MVQILVLDLSLQGDKVDDGRAVCSLVISQWKHKCVNYLGEKGEITMKLYIQYSCIDYMCVKSDKNGS